MTTTRQLSNGELPRKWRGKIAVTMPNLKVDPIAAIRNPPDDKGL